MVFRVIDMLFSTIFKGFFLLFFFFFFFLQ